LCETRQDSFARWCDAVSVSRRNAAALQPLQTLNADLTGEIASASFNEAEREAGIGNIERRHDESSEIDSVEKLGSNHFCSGAAGGACHRADA
jgi:hypothetical protein